MDNSIVDKIRKLAAKAESAKEIGNVEEGIAFSAKVQELLTKHNLEMAEITAEEDTSEIEGERHDDLNINDRWKINLLSTLCNYNYCSSIYYKHPKGSRYTANGRLKVIYDKKQTVTIIGKKENVEVVKYLYMLLSEQFVRLAKESWASTLRDVRERILEQVSKDHPAYKKPWKYTGLSSPSIYKKSFFKGAVRGVYMRLDEQQREAEAANIKITDLMVVNDNAINEYMEKHHPNIGTMRRSRSRINSAAYAQGQKAGRNASMARGVASGASVATKMIG